MIKTPQNQKTDWKKYFQLITDQRLISATQRENISKIADKINNPGKNVQKCTKYS
jgi:hypothetical protein